ncbi:MAG: hypothetical protein AAGB29_05185 [Planctomycetota bacterium]
MWSIDTVNVSARLTQLSVMRDRQRSSYAEVIDAWSSDTSLGEAFDEAIRRSAFGALRFETIAVTRRSAARPFEAVILDSPGLDVSADQSAFQEHFARAGAAEAVTFDNLRGDATLVVPTPVSQDVNYAHLAAFVREASPSQRQAIWRSIGEAMTSRLDERPVWLSTAGAGVAWLHVRLDDRPKYYRHVAYRAQP